MHRQDRNNANNIFGGHLLRLAAELAYSTAVLHAGRHCEAVAMSDVAFKQPVPIGCVLEMRAKVRPWEAGYSPCCCWLCCCQLLVT
jgi:acyl-coenzyme A thioesterase 9